MGANSATSSKAPMPPGMIMGPDGKPCKICTAFRNWRPGTTTGVEANEKGRTGGQKSTAAMMAALAAGSAVAAPLPRPDVPPPNCPPDVEQLGRATWTFLHTTAAYYPERPTPTQRANMLMLIRALPVLYPCTHCADDFGEDIKVNPPDVSGRVALSRWLCERHNQVNKKLRKDEFDCTKTDERWRDGPNDGSCD
ncbi:FAD-linked sulfhydryl oxidase ALR [Hypsizygus marmoreus]|uniref:Sulfhydryl oxidase n=1 Tax=Hypsizygus marmoreus TaxID=39966 RepID=A0A369JQN8_HYPMA|nr:FAD-linked sulfhydryl oxidase ALR [Hypsizygus marmoreus]